MSELANLYPTLGLIIGLNLGLLIIGGLYGYRVYAQRWSAITGKYFVQGKVLWSTYQLTSVSRYASKMLGTIAYKYSVEGKPYFGEYKSPESDGDKLVKKYPAGSKGTVFYSPNRPGFSQIDTPPSHQKLINGIVTNFIVYPLLLMNIALLLFLVW